jgi:hypothetical protein
VLAESILFCVNFAVQRSVHLQTGRFVGEFPRRKQGQLRRSPRPTSKLWLAVLVALIVLAGLGIEAYGFRYGESVLAIDLAAHRVPAVHAFHGDLRRRRAGGDRCRAILVKVLAVAATAIGTAFAVGPQALLAVVFFLIRAARSVRCCSVRSMAMSRSPKYSRHCLESACGYS